MNVKMEVDTRAFNEAASAALASTSRELSKAINSRLLNVGKRAFDLTKVADAAKIEHQLGVTGQSFKFTKGTSKRGMRVIKKSRENVYRKDSLAERIIVARLRKKGYRPSSYESLKDRAIGMIIARKSATGFIRSGWIDAMVRLAQAVGLKTRRRAKGGEMKGGASPATPSKLSAELRNTSLLTLNRFKTTGNPMPVAVKGLQAAYDAETAEIWRYLAEKVQKNLNKHSTKKA